MIGGTELLLLVSAAGGLGAVARYLLDRAFVALFSDWLWQTPQSNTDPRPSIWPWGVLAINVLGAFAAGAVLGLPTTWLTIVSIGFLGGLTTFSTVFVDVVRLFVARHRWRAAVYVAVTLAAITLAAWCGTALLNLVQSVGS
ncbi:fluoride efflux transporter FluC [Brevibacterium litoralis]|uniref:fluoride efflux transporter FluC n=1 Tax=Brevibacterium litoralis TaxID=3138935 RepID=UPI0032EDCCCF